MTRTALIVAGGPVLVGLLGAAVLPAIRSDLPDPVATHRDRSGPDGFTALRWVVLPLLVRPGRRCVVTVNGAAEAAALLTALTGRVHG